MMTYEIYDKNVHLLFEQAFIIRCNADSTIDELHAADGFIDDALSAATEMEVVNNDEDIQLEIINNRIRCYIERLAIHTRLMKMAYGTPLFGIVSKRHEELCNRYNHVYSHISNDEAQQSQYQLTIMTYQSLAANYFRRGGMGVNKAICQQAIDYLDKAIALANGDGNYNILHNNKLQILKAKTMANPQTAQEALARLQQLCSRGERCIASIRIKLDTWGIDRDEADEVIKLLVEDKYIDEVRYAVAFVRDKSRFSHWGAVKIQAALKSKNIPASVINNALKELDDLPYEEELESILEKKLKNIRASTATELKAKLIRFGLSRGFEYDLVYKYVNQLVK